MRKIKWVLPTMCLTAAAALVSTAVSARAEVNNDVIPDNIYIGEIAVGGMTANEAAAEVQSYVEGSIGMEFELKAEENSVKAGAADLGITWANPDVVDLALGFSKSGNLLERYKAKKDLEVSAKVFDIEYTIDTETAAAFLDASIESLNQEAIDSGLVRENGEFKITDGQSGIEVDKEASLKELQSFFDEEWDGADAQIDLVVDVVEPRGTTEELQKVKDVLGSFSTEFNTSASGRKTNVRNATSKINGTVVYPGDEFSVYDVIAPMTVENGYALGGAYENGTVIESVGGGVCQVSSTLYNAAIRAELEITERYPHSMLVSYVKPAMDAAIAGTYKNLRFINSTDAPIYLEGYCAGDVLYFNIYGHETRDPNREISFESETVSEEAPQVQIVASSSPVGTVETTQSAHIGKTAILWKIVKENGVEVSREKVNTSRYQSSPKIISVGTASSNPDASAAVTAAIASQDETAVRTAAAAWNDAALAAWAAEQAADAPVDAGEIQPAAPEDTGTNSSGPESAGQPVDDGV